MYYGWKHGDGTSVQGHYGCWGGLAFRDNNKRVVEIFMNLDDSTATHTVVEMLALEFQKADNSKQKWDSYKSQALYQVCETFLRKRVDWEIITATSNDGFYRKPGRYLVIKGIDKMPKNHLMHLLFGIKVSLGSAVHQMFQQLREAGVKSNRKMILGCQVGFQSVNFKGDLGVASNSAGGRIFTYRYFTARDFVPLYRGTKLPGPASEAWEEGSGYSTGHTGSLVLSAGCHSLKHETKDSREFIPSFSNRIVMDVMDKQFTQAVPFSFENKEECKKFFAKLAKILISIK
ncbi:MAG: hypothetical protein ACRDC4_06400 [Plesiomonas sp.]